ncbi:hypothetical protein [Clostridium saccharoperbutylacetonicum]|uniref:hypothetical protein n=1 Tax=Clostridium saccharoperbutylacetonicum TaxID=36745 RepID=UPI000983ECF8|nr:hypothetical protein [Clostridium saccharoperbutylacetonicum]AQR95546.1 hypothetical protein CLSAP_28620 [Clostridium saccharoperbutylacetonicum]NSB31406.1 hypothetical protein [Clostridium saccharoperbutylacetonicum]
MANAKRKKLKLNVKFINGAVACAKSPGQCKECSDSIQCEKMDLYYYPYKNNDIIECFRNNEKRR